MVVVLVSKGFLPYPFVLTNLDGDIIMHGPTLLFYIFTQQEEKGRI